MVEPASFNLDSELARILEDNVVSSTTTFLEVNTPFQIRVTTAQQLCNMNDHKDVALVFDMRSASAFDTCHVDKSVNFSIERFKEDNFIEWTSKVKALETDSSIFKNKQTMDLMKKRKRCFCYIIPCEQSHMLKRLLMELSHFGDSEKTVQAIQACSTESDKKDLLSLRNSLLLFKALKKERISECYISLEAFDHYENNYKHFLIGSDNLHLRPQPSIAKEFCNEMLPGRAYLGKWQHAKDAEMIKTLGITHILNISDSCENYLEGSHSDLTYLHLVVADVNHNEISNVFQEIFEFIRKSSESTESPEEIPQVDIATMTYPNSTSTIKLNFTTHASELEMNAQELQFSRIQNHIKAIRESSHTTCVLVHCAMGKSRSATAFIMYVMRRFGLSMSDAYEFCKSQRQETEPNEGFLEQLRRFEANGRLFESER